jgi:hypothetical protein
MVRNRACTAFPIDPFREPPSAIVASLVMEGQGFVIAEEGILSTVSFKAHFVEPQHRTVKAGRAKPPAAIPAFAGTIVVVRRPLDELLVFAMAIATGFAGRISTPTISSGFRQTR